MKIPAIKKLVETYSLDDLKKAELAFENGENPEIDVQGEGEGEQFTHVIAAAWILEKMESDDVDFKSALRQYTNKVRESIN